MLPPSSGSLYFKPLLYVDTHLVFSNRQQPVWNSKEREREQEDSGQ